MLRAPQALRERAESGGCLQSRNAATHLAAAPLIHSVKTRSL